MRTHTQLDLRKQWPVHTAQHVQVWPRRRGEAGRLSSKLVRMRTHNFTCMSTGRRICTCSSTYITCSSGGLPAPPHHSYQTSCTRAAGLLLARPTLPPARTPSHKPLGPLLYYFPPHYLCKSILCSAHREIRIKW